MESSDHIIDIDDVLLFDPFTLSGQSKINNLGIELTPDEFFGSFYCEPYFCQKNTPGSVGNKDNLSHRLTDEITALKPKEEKEAFEKHLYDSKGLLHIMGYSGSGKSIYLNYLLHKIKNRRQAFVFNLEESSTIIKKAKNRELDIYAASGGSSNIAPWLFAGLLIEKTYDIITGILKKEDQEIISGIQKQYEYLGEKEIGGNDALFGLFKKSSGELSIDTKGLIFDELKTRMCGNGGNNNINSIIQRILEALTRFLFCYIEAQKTIMRKNIKNYIFAFDNIEHYIKDYTIIFDADIELISTAVEQFTITAGKEYNDFYKYFKFIFAIRDTTARFLSTVHGSKVYDNVDVSSWYVFNEILSKKEGVLEKINPNLKTEKARGSLSILRTIMADKKGVGHNINELLFEMYNYNKRRAVRILNEVIRKMTELESGDSHLIPFATFQSYWNESPVVYKYLCRMAIIRLFLDFINLESESVKKVSFFDAIHVGHGEGQIGTYARRVLCFLLYESNGLINEKYVSFYSLVKGIFAPPGDNKLNIEVFNELAEILLTMNESLFDKFYWVQLIVPRLQSRSATFNS